MTKEEERELIINRLIREVKGLSRGSDLQVSVGERVGSTDQQALWRRANLRVLRGGKHG